MEKWIIPCNPKLYDVDGAFAKLKCLDWRQTAKSIEVNDEVYIYVGAPIKAIKYRCKVNKTNLHTLMIDDSEFELSKSLNRDTSIFMELELLETYDDSKYSYEKLKERGLKGNIQGPRRSLELID